MLNQVEEIEETEEHWPPTYAELLIIGANNAADQSAAYADRHCEYVGDDHFDRFADPCESTAQRWAVNYARHNLTGYDAALKAHENYWSINGLYEMCKSCQAKADADTDEEYGLEVDCFDCCAASEEVQADERKEYAEIRNSALDEVAAMYPELAEECENQKVDEAGNPLHGW